MIPVDDSAERSSTQELLSVVTGGRAWRALAANDIRSRYRRTYIGPFWITISTGCTALAIGIIYGQFFGQAVGSYLPYFTAGIVIWSLIASVLGEATTCLIGAGSLIKASNMPVVFHVMRMIQRNFIVMLHNLLIVILLWIVLRWPVGWDALLAVPGFALLYLFMTGVSLTISIICVRYRDVSPLVTAVTQFLFFASPIIWYPEQLRFGTLILHLNPIAYFLAVTRDPLLARPMLLENWIVAVLMTVMSVGVAGLLYVRYRDRVVYWV